MALSILVVDDSITTRLMAKKLISAALEGKEIKFTEAADGTDAVPLLREENDFDLVFLDLTMPVMTGYEVLEILKKEGLQYKIIVLTAYIQPEAQNVVRSLGASGYLEKPFRQEDAVQVLKEVGLL